MKTLSARNLIRQRPPRQSGIANNTVSKILKAAYRLYFRDKSTRQAVKRCLG
ncbi:MAG TPA: hypothetical protein VG733_12780 [Chthoniobacteraceae bacterium]|nr:hypothetical protein [Chthoniobacteraceae bacterium]